MGLTHPQPIREVLDRMDRATKGLDAALYEQKLSTQSLNETVEKLREAVNASNA